MTASISGRVIAWQRVHGRHGLPWQGTRDAYRIWLSEVMLQQTQVVTVIPYYERFLARFPDVRALAAAPLEQVLECWSGLGYYSRARNLHACAREVVASHSGVFPRTAAQLCLLPGIGRSTASAIAVFSAGERAPILDGNVKRVFCRVFGVEGFPGAPAVERELWQLAQEHLPPAPDARTAAQELVAYTQGLMDLGATVCTRARPDCARCPLADDCVARVQDRIAQLPGARPRRDTPTRAVTMLVVMHEGRVLLERRPPTGIWGGLWSLPEDPDAGPREARELVRRRFGLAGRDARELAPFTHAFTHFRLAVRPVRVDVDVPSPASGEPGLQWLALDAAGGAALPRPVRTLLEAIAGDTG